MKVLKVTLAVAFALALIITCASALMSAKTIEENILRFHIRANGNSEEEQAVKIAVRDCVLQGSAELFENSADTEESIRIATENLDYIRGIVDEKLEELGVQYRSTIKVSDEFFPTKYYGDMALPAGIYTALVIELGSGKGENWWCMLYPSLCPYGESVCQDERTKEELKALIGSENYKMITSSRPTVKFKIAELWGRMLSLVNTK